MTIEELAERARKAQSDHDKAVHAKKLAEQSIVVTSNVEGFNWECSATSPLITAHTIATVKEAMRVLSKDEYHEDLMELYTGLIVLLGAEE